VTGPAAGRSSEVAWPGASGHAIPVMKTLPACLLVGFLAAASAAASDLSFSVGYGTARLNGGASDTTPALLAKDANGNVSVFRLSLEYALSEKVGIAGSYLKFAGLSTVHALDPSVQTTVAADNRYTRDVQALTLGPTFVFVPADNWRIAASVGGVVSDLRTTFDGGGEGVKHYDNSGTPGWYGSVEASYEFAKPLSGGLALRYLDFNRKMASANSLTALHFEAFVALRF